MASAKLTLEEVDDRVHTHDIKIENIRELKIQNIL